MQSEIIRSSAFFVNELRQNLDTYQTDYKREKILIMQNKNNKKPNGLYSGLKPKDCNSWIVTLGCQVLKIK